MTMESNPRESMISTAVKFLQNEKVKESSRDQQVAFLEKKGLTSDEIKLAFERLSEQSALQVQYTPYPPHHYHGQHQTMPYSTELSTWSRMRENFLSLVVMGGFGYVLYRVLKRYVIPLLWEDETNKRLNTIEEQNQNSQKTHQETLATVRELVSLVNEQMRLQNEQLQIIISNTNSNRGGDDKQLVEIKTGITTLKGLLLNRRQFPPTPQTTPIIPSWQRESPPPDDKLTSPVSSRSISPHETSPQTSNSWVRVDTSPTRHPDTRTDDVSAETNDVTAPLARPDTNNLTINDNPHGIADAQNDVITNGDVTNATEIDNIKNADGTGNDVLHSEMSGLSES